MPTWPQQAHRPAETSGADSAAASSVLCAWCGEAIALPWKACSAATPAERRAIVMAIAAGGAISEACKRELAARGG